MTPHDFLAKLGWPAEHIGSLGNATWSAPSADGMSKLSVGIARESKRVGAWIEHVGFEGNESLVRIEATIESGAVSVEVATTGNPPESVPAEDAIDVFIHMRSEVGKMTFTNNGPVELPEALHAKPRG